MKLGLRIALFALATTLPVGLACSSSDDGRDGDGLGSGSTGNGASGNGADGNGASSGSGASSSTGGSIGNGTGSTNGSGGESGICQKYTAVSEAKPPTVLILLDQSGSMKQTVEDGITRWAAATASVKDATTALQDQAKFGLIGFPTHVISSDADASQSCNAKLYVGPAVHSAAAIASGINPAVPNIGHTPTRAALNLALSELSKPTYAEDDRYVVLVTDGLPNCKGISPTSNGGYFANYEDPSDAVTALKDAGITTFVVGYDIANLASQWSEGKEHTAVTYANNMAAAGGTSEHRPVASGEELVSVLTDITRSVAPCSFELDAEPRGGETYVRVSIDGTDYAVSDANGWDLEGTKTIALREDGAACQKLRDGGTHSVDIVVECEPVIVK